MKFLIIASFLLSACASGNLKRTPASSEGAYLNLKRLQSILITAKADCQIDVTEAILDFSQQFANANLYPALQITITPKERKERKLTIFGEPAVTYAKFRDRTTELFSSAILESPDPGFPGRLTLERAESGKINSLKILEPAMAYMDGKGPQYGRPYEPCVFEK